jgi:hypothetical protein
MGIERTVLPDRSLNAGNGIFVQLPGPRRALLLDAQFVQGGRLAIGRCHSGTALNWASLPLRLVPTWPKTGLAALHLVGLQTNFLQRIGAAREMAWYYWLLIAVGLWIVGGRTFVWWMRRRPGASTHEAEKSEIR